MVSLIWKETREKLLWAAALYLICMHSSWTRGYTFYGEPGLKMLSWSMGPVLMAFLMGASGYTSELTSRRAVFLLTRPVTWKGILASKLIVNTGVIVLASVFAAVTYRLTCPPAYASLATMSALTEGVLLAVLFMGLSFLVGFASSCVFAGTAESAAFVIVQGTLLVCLFSAAGAGAEGWWRQIMQLFWPLPLLAAGVAVVRSGIALSAGERLRRYISVALVGILLLAVAAYLIPSPLINKMVSDRLNHEYVDWSISPDGLYALGRDYRSIYWLDIEHNRCTRCEFVYEDYSARRVSFDYVGWMSPHTAYRIGYDRDIWFIRIYHQTKDSVESHDITMGRLTDRDGYPNEVVASPDGRIAAVLLSTGMDRPQTAVFADIAERRRLEPRIITAAKPRAWWNSSDEFHFVDARGTANTVYLRRWTALNR